MYPVIRVGRKWLERRKQWRVRLYIDGKPQRDAFYDCGRKAHDAATRMLWDRGSVTTFEQETA